MISDSVRQMAYPGASVRAPAADSRWGPSVSPMSKLYAGTFSEVRPALEKMEQELAQMSAIQAAVTR